MLFSYIDPGTGSMLISATVALVSVGFFMLKGLIYRKFGLGGSKGESVDPNVTRNLVIYSEGKQYWNVFKEIVEGACEEGIELSYFTSDLEDPALSLDYDNIECKYIGSGREAYYLLNRLNANVVLMTTPGLDVLELKRSKNVKHYIHISHATGSMADYKTYGIDYYDSILLGGSGDIEVIRELEELRKLKPKTIEVIGHTYLDVLRDNVEELNHEDSFFDNDKLTVLVSPTWGMYSLLVNNGDMLLGQLEKEGKYNVIVRPHPQSFISDKVVMDTLMAKFPENDSLKWDIGTDNIKAMWNADIMISDYSGIIFDYFSLFKKPILTMHSLFKKEGLDAMDLQKDPWNIKLLEQIGNVVHSEDIIDISSIISKTIALSVGSQTSTKAVIETMSMYEGESKRRALSALKARLDEYRIDKTLLSDKNDGSNHVLSKNLGDSLILDGFITSVIITLTTFILSNKILPLGNTVTMLYTIKLPLIILSVVLMFSILFHTIFINKGSFLFNKKMESFDYKSLFLVLIPMVPIGQYVIANQDILNFNANIKVAGLFLIIAVIFIVLIPWILSIFVSQSLSQAVFTSYVFMIYNMASYGADFRIRYIILIFSIMSLGIYLLSSFNKSKIIVLLSTVLFMSSTVSSLINMPKIYGSSKNLSDKEKAFVKYIDSHKAVYKPNIYFLIYDSYANQETYDSYGYDNSNQMDYLLDEGFAIYDGMGLTQLDIRH